MPIGQREESFACCGSTQGGEETGLRHRRGKGAMKERVSLKVVGHTTYSLTQNNLATHDLRITISTVNTMVKLTIGTLSPKSTHRKSYT